MARKDDVRWGLAKRFELIEWRVYWDGRINRGEIEERFGVSTPQASLDLRAYQEAAPNNIRYDPTEKAYVPTETFEPRFLQLSADTYLLQLNAIINGAIPALDTWFGSRPPAAAMPLVVRSVAPSVLRAVLKGIEGGQELDIVYQSLTKTSPRTIAPHSLAFDGHRWHARAWCRKRQEFRDFVLSRIQSVGSSRQSDGDPSNDIEWHTIVELKISPHPKLAEAQQSVIAQDFCMVDGLLSIQTRAALAFYLIKRLNLDLDERQITPERQQLFLTNKSEIEAKIAAAKARTKDIAAEKQKFA